MRGGRRWSVGSTVSSWFARWQWHVMFTVLVALVGLIQWQLRRRRQILEGRQAQAQAQVQAKRGAVGVSSHGSGCVRVFSHRYVHQGECEKRHRKLLPVIYPYLFPPFLSVFLSFCLSFCLALMPLFQNKGYIRSTKGINVSLTRALSHTLSLSLSFFPSFFSLFIFALAIVSAGCTFPSFSRSPLPSGCKGLISMPSTKINWEVGVSVKAAAMGEAMGTSIR